jgi:hypothetical protein
MTSLQSMFQNVPNLSPQSADLLIQNLDGQTGLGCVGAQIDDLNTDDVTLLALVLDANDVIDAFNAMTRALYDSKARDSIMMSCWAFSNASTLRFSHTLIDSVADLKPDDYEPAGGTALYDAVLDSITGLVAYSQTLRNSGIRPRAVVVVISDGDDNMSSHTAAAVKTVVDDLIKQETYTFAFIGLGDAKTFRGIAQSMGFPSILTIGQSASDIRRALNMVSSSVIRTSQAKVATAGNSFFTP